MKLPDMLTSAIKKVIPKAIKYRLQSFKDPRLLLLRKMPKHAVCAEIGVWKGDFSERIIDITKPKELHLIDPWEFQSDFPSLWYGGAKAKSENDMEAIYRDVKQKFKKNQNIVVNRGKSEDVLSKFPDRYFDWIYIDGNHYYEYVLRDLEMCFTKVKKDGVIAGDDYLWGAKDDFPVKQAVHHFGQRHNLIGNLTVLHSQFYFKV